MTKFDTLQAALEQSGQLLMKYFGNIQQIERKSEIDLVTQADHEAEELIKKLITSAHPDDEILGEESGLQKSTNSNVRWLVDPVDGTTNFAHGVPIFCTSIAVEVNGEIVLAGVSNPYMKETYLAETGAGATLNGRRIHVSTIDKLADSMVISGFPYDRRERTQHYLKAWELMMGRAQGLLRMGSAALDLCYVAAGRAEAYWEESLHPWDTAAGMLILQEAGGKITNFKGEPYNPYMKQVLGTNGLVHQEVSAILEERQRYSEQYCPEQCR